MGYCPESPEFFLCAAFDAIEEEIEAWLLGARWVAQRTDKQLSDGAKNALE